MEKKSRSKNSKWRSSAHADNEAADVPGKAKAAHDKDKTCMLHCLPRHTPMSLPFLMANLSLVPSVQEEPDVRSPSKLDVAAPDDGDVTIAPEDIIELEDLAAHTEKVLMRLLDDERDVIALRDQLSGLSEIAQRLRHSRKKLDESKSKFGKQEYISVEAVRRALKSQNFDPVLQEANLAVLTTFICTVTPDNDQMYENLRALGRQFPRNIGESITADNFGLVLDLRTQILIAALQMYRDEEHTSPVDLLNHIFFAKGGDPRPFLPFGGDMEYPGWKEATEKRELELYGLLGHDSAEGGLKALREKYPWDDFANKMVVYSRLLRKDRKRQARVAAAVAAVGGSFSDGQQNPPAEGSRIVPVPVPEKRAHRRDHRFVICDSSFLVDSNLSSRKPQASRVSFKLGDIRALEQDLDELSPGEEEGDEQEVALGDNEREELVRQQDQAKHHRVDEAPNATSLSDGPEPQQGENAALPPSPTAPQLLDFYFSHQTEINKENQATKPVAGSSKPRFLDPQPGATRIEFDTQLEEARESDSRRSSKAAEKGQGRKRRRSPIEDEDDSEGFVEDSREENGVRRKRSRQIVEEVDPWVQPPPAVVAQPIGTSVARHSNVSARSRASASSAARTSSDRRSEGLHNQLTRASNASSTVRRSDAHRNDIYRNELVPAHIGAHNRRSLSPPSEEDNLASMVNRIERLSKTMNGRRGIGGARRGRKPWTEAQANMLVAMISKYGTNWQLIASVCPLSTYPPVMYTRLNDPGYLEG